MCEQLEMWYRFLSKDFRCCVLGQGGRFYESQFPTTPMNVPLVFIISSVTFFDRDICVTTTLVNVCEFKDRHIQNCVQGMKIKLTVNLHGCLLISTYSTTAFLLLLRINISMFIQSKIGNSVSYSITISNGEEYCVCPQLISTEISNIILLGKGNWY